MSDELESEMLAAFRAHRRPEADRVDRNWHAFQSKIASPSPEPATETPDPVSTPTSPRTRAPTRWWPWLVAGTAVVGAALAVTAWPSSPRSTVPVTVEEVPAPIEPAPLPVSDAEKAVTVPPEDPGSPRAGPPAPLSPPDPEPAEASPTKPRTRPKAIADPTASELELIIQAKAELDRGAHRAALRTTKELEQRFPDGRLIDERKLLRVRALCGSGKKSRARKEIARFLDAKPTSAFADRMRKACPE